MTENNPFAMMVAENREVSVIDDAAFNQLVQSAAWLPQLKLVSSRSGLVQPPTSLKAGTWVLKRNQKYQDLGTSPVVVPVAMRLKAVTSTFTQEGEVWVSYYDPASKDFQAVVAKASVKGQVGAFYGPEYLLWIDGAQEGGQGGEWALLMCASESARRVAGELNLGVKGMYPMSLPVSIAKKGKWSWEVFTPERYAGNLQYYPSGTDLASRVETFKKEAAAGATIESADGESREQ